MVLFLKVFQPQHQTLHANEKVPYYIPFIWIAHEALGLPGWQTELGCSGQD